jgi:antitoxin component YwqK of YwqJK toxin-antitoxin module
MNEQVKFARWVLIHTDEAKHTAGVCRYYQNKLYTIDEIFDIYTNIQSKSENAKLTPLIEYYSNGNVWIKGQKNSKGQEEGIWEWFYEDGNIRIRTPHKEGKIDGIVECFDEQGNIIKTYVWKDGKLIEETQH